MAPEDILATLLDSRTPGPSASGDIRSDPTGVRVLQSLGLGQRGVTTIAEEAAISRQTVYRVLTRYRHAGLVRSETGRYVISCTGTGLLGVYEEAKPEITPKELSQLARSRHRRWILARLDDAPSRKAELVGGEDGEGPSRSTVHRIVESMLGDGYLEHRGDGYALTGRGRRLREAYTALRSTAAQAIDKRAFSRWLPGELDEFPIAAVDDATLIRNHPDQPHNVLDTYVRAADPAPDRFRGMSAVLSPALTRVHIGR